MFTKFVFLLLFSVAIISAQKVRYDNYALYRIYAQNEGELKFLNNIEESNDLHLWKSAVNVGDYVSIIASPKKRIGFESELKKRNIGYDVMLENIQDAFEDELIINRMKRDTRNQLFWTNYQTMDDIYAWFHHLADTHSDIVSIIHGGKSYEGRNITGVKISRRPSRRAIFIEGGQVAADWLSPTVVTYIVDQLVKDPVIKEATEDFEWHIFPILNPDGHEFTQNSNRVWLKNRRPTSGSAVGVDLTKNWNSQWGVRGASFNPPDSNYIGLGPFSEVETRSISRYIESMDARLSGLLSFRGFGQRLIVPFAHTLSHMYNYNETILIGRRAMGSLAVRYNTQYLVGTSMEVHDGATGSIADWAKHRYNPPIVATYQLRDNGAFGYILPVNQVLPTCEETFDSVVAILREAKYIDVL